MKDGDRTDRESTQEYAPGRGHQMQPALVKSLVARSDDLGRRLAKKTFQMRRMHGAIPHFTA